MTDQFDLQNTASLSEIYSRINTDLHTSTDYSTGEPRTVIEHGHGKTLQILDDMVRAILASKEPFFETTTTRQGKKRFKQTQLGNHFFKLNLHRKAYKPGCLFSEHIELLFRHMRDLGLWQVRFTHPDANLPLSKKYQGDLCNTLVEELRKEGNTPAFKRRVARRAEKAKKNTDSTIAYEADLFGWRSRINIMRLDLGFGAEHSAHITIEQAKYYLNKLLNNRRSNSMFAALGGYIWRLEYGGDGKGYHFHVILFFDGSELLKDAYNADLIGKYWIDVITKGKGAYHNCNRDKSAYKRLGIGMVHRHNDEKRKALREDVIPYLTKKDYCFRPEMSGARVIGKGEI